MKEVLGDRVEAVKPSARLVDSPAMIVNVGGFMTSSMERLLKASGQGDPMSMGGKKNIAVLNRQRAAVHRHSLVTKIGRAHV